MVDVKSTFPPEHTGLLLAVIEIAGTSVELTINVILLDAAGFGNAQGELELSSTYT